jgi:integrase
MPKLARPSKKRRPVKRERLAGLTVTVQRTKRKDYAAVVVMRRDGQRMREKYLPTMAEAEALAQKWSIEAGNTGAAAAASITDADKRFVMEARAKLSAYGRTLKDAVTHYLAHLERCKASITIQVLADRLMLLKQGENRSRRYQDDLRIRLGKFVNVFGQRVAADITTEEISSWLAGLRGSGVTIANYRRLVRVLFSYAVKIKACSENPVDGAFDPAIIEKPIGILTPAEAAALLAAAEAKPEILPAIAIGLFAGVRDEEMRKLDWTDMNFETGYISIQAKGAKSARRRLIKMRPALLDWLGRCRQVAGPVWPIKSEHGRILHESVRRAAGFGRPGSETEAERAQGLILKPWPHNALRHSFASYDLAKTKDAAALALEMGHTSNALIFQHYREVVAPVAAEAYWQLTPSRVLAKTAPLPAKEAKRRQPSTTKARAAVA